MNPDQLRQYLEFYQDLGVKELYRVSAQQAQAAAAAPAPIAGARTFRSNCPRSCRRTTRSKAFAPTSAIAVDAGFASSATRSCSASATSRRSSCLWARVRAPTKTRRVFPFVGRAGQLLTQMIEGTASKEGIPIKREDVYICNVVKCRPPENRTPQPDEMEICGQFLFRQLSVHPAEGDLRAGLDGCEGGSRDQRRRHAAARQLAQMARHPGHGDVSSVVSAAALQPERQARGVGRPEEGSALRV